MTVVGIQSDLISNCAKNRVSFTSNPDLTRHKRTVHSDNLNRKTYICTCGDYAKENPLKK
ncbi:unnamed protein product [Clonostachys solani]|uniref:Uncharacterized protein n=1 Tax=Clonostachys solani TaxID=160281 RepID=A0A9P0ELR6_9HYPO|nr:unnamed protein product [Clonostachys solani]